MTAVRYRVGHRLRRELGPTVLAALAIAVVVGSVLAFAAGARRTSSAPERYVAATNDRFDTAITQDRGAPRVDEVAGLPALEEAVGATFVFGGLVGPDGNPSDTFVFAGSIDALGSHLVSGRLPDPTVPGEFTLTASGAAATGWSVGDTARLLTITQETVDRDGFFAEPDGPVLDAQLVGVIDGPGEGDPTRSAEPLAVFPRSLLDDETIGVSTTIIAARRAPGADLEAVRDQLAAFESQAAFSVAAAEPVNPAVRNAVRIVARGLWVLTGIAATAALAALGLLLTRRSRLSDLDTSSLTAVGYRSVDLRTEQLLTAAAPVALGVWGGIVVAIVASRFFPFGFSRNLEPTPGTRADWGVLLPGAVGAVVALVAWVLVALMCRSARARGVGRRARALAPAAARAPDAAVETGIRFAFMRARGDTGAVGASAVGLGVILAAVAAAVLTGTSMDRVAGDPTRYGLNFDVWIGPGQTSVDGDVRDGVLGDPDVAAVAAMGTSEVLVGTTPLTVVGVEQLRGSLMPRVLEGRAPVGDDDIALGRVAARRLRADIGDTITASGDGGTVEVRVVGLAVIPGIEGNEGAGEDAVMTMSGLRRLLAEPDAGNLMARIRKDAQPGAALRLQQVYGGVIADDNSLPAVVKNLTRVRFVPTALVVFLLGLAMLTATQAVVASVRNRRKDFAVLQALGATRGWNRRAAVTQAVVLAALPLAIAVPVGLAGGREVFQAIADDIGVVNDASYPFMWVGLGGLVVIAALGALAFVRTRQVLRTSVLWLRHE